MRRKLDGKKYNFIHMLLSTISVFLLALFSVSLLVVLFRSTSDDLWQNENCFTAAVVEYVPINLTSIKDTILANLLQYEKIINQSKESSVDIIVFPECGLTGCNYNDRDYVIKEVAETVPSPDLGVIPCEKKSYSKVLSTLSCVAQQNSMYVVVNLLEKFTTTAEYSRINSRNNFSETLLYNTNVVFDRQGQIVARYRKFNLYSERTHLGVNSTDQPELSTFTTDFGVTFGIIICFDIIFKQPVYDLLHKKNVSSIIFSGAVFSELPFLVVSSLGAGWSYSMNTTLLFSDMPVRAGSVGGSGIFVGSSDPLNVIMQEHNDSKILISKVPKRRTFPVSSSSFYYEKNERSIKSNFNESVFIVDSELDYYVNQSLTKNMTYISDNLMMNKFIHTNENFTCAIDIVWKVNFNASSRSEYKFLSFAGKRNFSIASIENYVEACGITLCNKSSNESCSEPPYFEDSSSISLISLNIFSLSSIDAIVIPSTLDNNLYPLSVNYFTFEKFAVKLLDRNCFIVKMNLIRPISDLITFGFYKLPENSHSDISEQYNKNVTEVL